MSTPEGSVVLIGPAGGRIEIFYRRSEDASIELVSLMIGCEVTRLDALHMLDAGLVNRVKQWVGERVAENQGGSHDHL